LEWSEREYPSEFGNLSVGALVSAADESYILHGVRGTAGYEAVALRSRDGMTWEQIDTGLPQVIYVQAIERGPAGYLLVGGQGADTNPTLWLSEDGLAWELVHEFDQTEQWVQIHDADGGEEGYVVLGRRIEPDNSYRRFAFASADGRTWFSRDQPFGADNQAYVAEASVSSLGPDWVATLGQPDAPTAVWFSTDGLGWSEVGSVDAPANTSTAEFHEVAGALVFSPGSGLRGLPEGTAGVWSSVDGVGWAPVDFGADVWLGGIAEGDGITAAIGTLPRPDFTSAASIWVRVSD